MACSLSCVNFIKIDQIVFAYGWLKFSNLLKPNEKIINSVKLTAYIPVIEALCYKEKV